VRPTDNISNLEIPSELLFNDFNSLRISKAISSSFQKGLNLRTGFGIKNVSSKSSNPIA
jgi:hypothetical protein